jgi:hypothetical protein
MKYINFNNLLCKKDEVYAQCNNFDSFALSLTLNFKFVNDRPNYWSFITNSIN